MKFIPSPHVFKEGCGEAYRDVYRSCDGWTIEFNSNGIYEVPTRQWIVRDENRKVLDQETKEMSRHGVFIKNGKPIETFSRGQRTGRTGGTYLDMKLGVAHFPKGTVFQICPFIGRDDTIGDRTYTVDKVICNGPGSFVLTTTHTCIDGCFKGQQWMVNISHVVRVISRGKGPLVVENHKSIVDPWPSDLRQMHKENLDLINIMVSRGEAKPIWRLRKDEVVFKIPEYLYDFVPSNYCGQRIKHGALEKFGKSMGFLRLHVTDHEWFYIFNVKKFKRWVKSNAHRLFQTVKSSWEAEGVESRSYYD